ncbi:hypothetical protein FKW77_006985 [Venturia effusa]|uniref:Uncharacterized protein n=1 Tax=Venturia effusa TaxID=50376 RepID=A0A517LB26_9PEZI|nr:hypothetical protein FKW77_006985 [Venturia effusa]
MSGSNRPSEPEGTLALTPRDAASNSNVAAKSEKSSDMCAIDSRAFPTTGKHNLKSNASRDMLNSDLGSSFESLPREIRQHIISYAFDILYQASYFSQWYIVQTVGEENCLYVFWCVVWEITEWLKSAFPNHKDDVEYIRITWAGFPPQTSDFEEEDTGVLAANWKDKNFIRQDPRSCLAPEGWMMGGGWLWDDRKPWTRFRVL